MPEPALKWPVVCVVRWTGALSVISLYLGHNSAVVKEILQRLVPVKGW